MPVDCLVNVHSAKANTNSQQCHGTLNKRQIEGKSYISTKTTSLKPLLFDHFAPTMLHVC